VQLSINRSIHYVKHHWQGSLSLPIAFWMNGTSTAFILAMLTTFGIDGIHESNLSQEAWVAATLALLGVCVLSSVWVIIGIWRSATNYPKHGGRVVLTIAAKVVVLISAFGLAAHFNRASAAAVETAFIFAGIDPIGHPATLAVNGRILHIDGTITATVAERFQALISKHPEVDQISITSDGGRTHAALEIASIITKRKLSTVAIDECSSACTLIFLAGKTRALDAYSALGFHGPKVLGVSDLEARNSAYDLIKAYNIAELSEAFINHALDTPPDEMWYPSEDVLIKEGAVNLFTNARIRQEHQQSIKSFKETMPLKIDEWTSVVSAKTQKTNITYTYVISLRKDEIDWTTMSKDGQRDVDALICGDAISNLMVKSGASYSHLYVDKRGEKVGLIKVEKCQHPWTG
jgi:hypothetical protein